jgi:hypothetical protein
LIIAAAFSNLILEAQGISLELSFEGGYMPEQDEIRHSEEIEPQSSGLLLSVEPLGETPSYKLSADTDKSDSTDTDGTDEEESDADGTDASDADGTDTGVDADGTDPLGTAEGDTDSSDTSDADGTDAG